MSQMLQNGMHVSVRGGIGVVDEQHTLLGNPICHETLLVPIHRKQPLRDTTLRVPIRVAVTLV